MGASFNVKTTFSAVDNFSPQLKKMSTATSNFATKAQGSLNRVQRGLDKLTPSIGSNVKQFLKLGAVMAVGGFASKAITDYDNSIASLSAITGVTGDKLEVFKGKLLEVANAQKISTAETAKGFEIVGSFKAELLQDADALAKVTNASILLSKAVGTDLAINAEVATGVMNQFELGADQAMRTVNALAAGQKAGAATTDRVSLAIDKFGATAMSSNISLEQSIALVEVMGRKSLFAENAGTLLNSAIINLKKAGVGYSSGLFDINDALTELKTKVDSSTTAIGKDKMMIEAFGKTGITAGEILLSNIDNFQSLTKAVTGTTEAEDQARIKTNTFSKKLEELQNRFATVISSTTSASTGLNVLGGIIVFITDNMELLVTVLLLYVGALIVMRTVLAISTAVTWAFNVALGIQSVMQNASRLGMIAGTTAMAGYKVGLALATAAQWFFNGSLIAGTLPVWLIAVAITALIAIVVTMIYYWDEFGAAMSIMLGPLGLMINLIMTFKKHWDSITESFETGGMLEGLKRIGAVLLDVILYPVEQLIGLLDRIPGIDLNTGFISDMRAELDLVTPDEKAQVINNEQSRDEARTSREEKIERGEVGLTIKNESGNGIDADITGGVAGMRISGI